MEFPESKIIEDFQNGKSTAGWLFNDLRMLYYELAKDAELLNRIENHENPDVVNTAKQIVEMENDLRNRETDKQVILSTLDLKPDQEMKLFGGYDAAFGDAFWLDGNEFYIAKFIQFLSYAKGKPPALLAKLQEPIKLKAADGYVYEGEFVLVTTSDWLEKRPVVVYLVKTVPENVGEFFASSPRMIEDHASWEII